MDRPSFLLFVRAVLPVRAPEAPSGGLLRLGSQVFTEASCSPRLHCAEWWCVVLSDWPRHHGGSGRDWPYKSACRTSAFVDRADDNWRQQPMPRVIRHAVAVRHSRKGGNKVQRASAVKNRGILVCGFARRPPAASARALPAAIPNGISSL
jgi:hypothetical protein